MAFAKTHPNTCRPTLQRSALLGLLCVALVATATAQCPIQLSDITHQTGISFKHTDGSTGQYYIMETVSAGLALWLVPPGFGAGLSFGLAFVVAIAATLAEAISPWGLDNLLIPTASGLVLFLIL